MDYNFCPQCGKTLSFKSVGDEGIQKYCLFCNKFYFDNPSCCILAAILNKERQVLLLKQNYISKEKYTLCSGYVKTGDTLEETVVREVSEETGQKVLSCEYIQSYYFAPKKLIMCGFIAYVEKSPFNESKEVDMLMWANLDNAAELVERENNFSGQHLDNCIKALRQKR